MVRCDESFAPYALEGELLAYDGLRCGPGPGGAVVRSLASGATTTVETGDGTPTALALAGDVLAAALEEGSEGSLGPPPGRVSVWNWRTGHQLATAALPPGLSVDGLDVAPDGTAALVTKRYGAGGRGCGGVVRVVSPPAVEPRQLATGACGALHLAGAEVLVEKRRGVVAIGVDGGERPFLRTGRIRLAGLDEDGQRVAFAVPSCGGDHTVHLVPLAGPPRTAGPATCPVAVPRQRLRLSPGRRLAVEAPVRPRLHGRRGGQAAWRPGAAGPLRGEPRSGRG